MIPLVVICAAYVTGAASIGTMWWQEPRVMRPAREVMAFSILFWPITVTICLVYLAAERMGRR